MTDADAPKKRGKQKGARANREGKPWKRSDGRWCMRLYPPKGTIWKTPKYVYGKTAKEVKEKHAEAVTRQALGLPDASGDVLIGDYLHRWLYETLPQYVRAGEMAESTMDSYRQLAEKHIISREPGVPTLAGVGMLELTAPMVREWRDELSRKPTGRRRTKLRPGETELPPVPVLKPRTVAYCRAILHKALGDAVRDEVAGLQRNVVDLVKPPKDRREAETVILTPEQGAALFVALSSDRLWCYWLVAFAQGFRRGEGLGMRWEDLDLEALTWKPSQSVQRLRGEVDPETGRRKGKLVAKELKTRESGKKTALTRAAADALTAWQTEQKKMRMASPQWADLGLVFTTGYGTALEPRNVNRAWDKLCERAGVTGLRLHDLRHACASYLLAAGVNSKVVQRTLRHARLATTELYLHALEEVPREAADKMDEIIAGFRAMEPRKQAR